MKARSTQGSFIILIWTLIATVKRITAAPCVFVYPRADKVASLLLHPVLCRCMQRRQADEARLSQRVFRYSSSSSDAPSYASSSFLWGVQR
jgi:hypothetical protein